MRRSHNGQSTVFDVVDIKHIIPYLPEDNTVPIKYVLVYLPFTDIGTRMAVRTEQAKERQDFGDQRIGFGPLQQFGDIYTVVPKESKDALGTLDTKLVTDLYQIQFDAATVYDQEHGHELPSASDLAIEREEFPKRLLANLGAEQESGEFAIGPKTHPQEQDYLIVETATSKPADIAQRIRNAPTPDVVV